MKHRRWCLAVLFAAALAACGGPAAPADQPEASPAVTADSSPTPRPAAATPTANPTPRPPAATPTASPTPQPAAQSLVIEEYPIANQAVDQPTHLEFMQRIPAEVLDKRRAWREPDPDKMAATANQSLAAFGYRLAARRTADGASFLFDLYKDDKLILADIASFRPPAVSRSGSDLAMQAETMDGQVFLVRPERGDVWDAARYAFIAPVFAGDDLVTVEMAQQGSFIVRRGGEQVYSVAASGAMVELPVKRLGAWEGQWVLEADGQLIVDGKSLNDQLGYEEIFGWRLLGGEPLYFFKKEGQVHVSYAGEVLPQQYDDVVHYQCCEPAAFNVQGNDAMVWFYGLRGGVWHYVEMGRY